MGNSEFEQARTLVLETAALMAKYKSDSAQIVRNIHNEVHESLSMQRTMIVDMVRDDVAKEATFVVGRYVEDMDNARKQMLRQVAEFNAYLSEVNSANKKLSMRMIWISAVTLVSLLIGGITLVVFYSGIIKDKKIESEMVSIINNADIVRCGDKLCARVGKAKDKNGYSIIRDRL